MHNIVYVNDLLVASFVAIIIIKHSNTSQLTLFVIIYKQLLLNILVSKRRASNGFPTAVVLSAGYCACIVKYKPPLLHDIHTEGISLSLLGVCAYWREHVLAQTGSLQLMGSCSAI